jgi:hypothetical protein
MESPGIPGRFRLFLNNDRDEALNAVAAGAVSCVLCDDNSLLLTIDRGDGSPIYVSATPGEPLRITTQAGGAHCKAGDAMTEDEPPDIGEWEPIARRGQLSLTVITAAAAWLTEF